MLYHKLKKQIKWINFQLPLKLTLTNWDPLFKINWLHSSSFCSKKLSSFINGTFLHVVQKSPETTERHNAKAKRLYKGYGGTPWREQSSSKSKSRINKSNKTVNNTTYFLLHNQINRACIYIYNYRWTMKRHRSARLEGDQSRILWKCRGVSPGFRQCRISPWTLVAPPYSLSVVPLSILKFQTFAFVSPSVTPLIHVLKLCSEKSVRHVLANFTELSISSIFSPFSVIEPVNTFGLRIKMVQKM